MSSPYDMAYEDYARERREYLKKRSESCNHKWAPDECSEEGIVTKIYCRECGLVKEVNING